MPSKKFRPFSEDGSAPAEFALLLTPTLGVLICLLTMSHSLVQLGVDGWRCFKFGQRFSAADLSRFPASGFSVERFVHRGIPFVGVAPEFGAVQTEYFVDQNIR